jgi:hypothetical protein
MVYSLRADVLILARDVMGAEVPTQLAAYNYLTQNRSNRLHITSF